MGERHSSGDAGIAVRLPSHDRPARITGIMQPSFLNNLKTTSFERTWSMHRERVWRLVARMSSDTDVADDLTQEVAVRAFEGYSLFRGGSQAYTWLYRIAVNVVLRHRERKALPTEFDADIRLADSSRGPEATAIANDRASRLRRAVDRLPEENRIVLVLNVYEQLKYREIAEILQIPEGTVKSRRHTAAQLLRKELEDYEM